jgi:hypothetical protein
MGNSALDKQTQEIKARELTQVIDRKCGNELGSEVESVKVTVKAGYLLAAGERILLEYPEGEVKYYQVDPFQKEISLFLRNSRKWTFSFVTLNDFLAWKRHLAISMRPALLNSKNCQNCDRSLFFASSYNCHFCGQKLCSFCSRFVSQLNFLGYINSARICESCIDPINRIKTEEVESFVKRAETGSFMRNSSIYEVVPELLD